MTTPVNRPAPGEWDPGIPDDPNAWKGWLTDHSKQFDNGVKKLKVDLQKAFEKIAGDGIEGGNPGDPTNPQHLADYQTKLSEYTTFRSLQSNSAKSLADMQKQNARNLG